jgi:hypothetical protein
MILFSLLITVLYLAYTIKLFGVPWSISDTYYKLERKKKGLGILFTAWAWMASLPLLIGWLDKTEGLVFQFLPFLACGSLMFVGAAAQFKQSLTEMVHYVSAGICVASALTWVVLVGYWYIPTITFAICIGIALKYSKWITWIEIASLTATYITLLITQMQ